MRRISKPATLPEIDSNYWKESTDAFLIVIDPRMRIRYVTENCEKVIGYPASELIGASSLLFVPPDDVVEHLNLHEELLKGDFREKVSRIQHKNGGFVELSIQLIPVKTEGVVEEIRGVCRALSAGTKA